MQNQAPGSGLIYPGTKWCGPGNVTVGYNDLGHHSAEDACCREHDHCPFTIASGQCIHGICNNSPFTRSHCDCDAKFRRCLQNLNTEVANTLGALFFNVIQVTCFKERRPCSQWQRYIFYILYKEIKYSKFYNSTYIHFRQIFTLDSYITKIFYRAIIRGARIFDRSFN